MDSSTPVRKPCETCLFWEGKSTSYLGMCCHPQNYPSRVPFDYTCPLYIEHDPIFSMQLTEQNALLSHDQ